MAKRSMKPGNMVYPVPAALISVRGKDGKTNLMTAAWVGTVCSDPPMVYVSIRKSRATHQMILDTGEYVVNLTTEAIAKATDLCGVISGRDGDKWKKSGLTEEPASVVAAPLVKESPVSIECKVTQVLELGSHDMFLAKVVAVSADETLFDEKDRLDLSRAGLIAYSHGEYQALGKKLGSFGYAVRKKRNGKKTGGSGKKPR